jgi:predicted Co/Zn/Cd cation transporter (cation efflux family)
MMRGVQRHALVAVDGALALIAVVLIVQMWLLSATLEAFLGGRHDVVLPAALVSIALCAICLVLGGFVRRIERRAEQSSKSS